MRHWEARSTPGPGFKVAVSGGRVNCISAARTMKQNAVRMSEIVGRRRREEARKYFFREKLIRVSSRRLLQGLWLRRFEICLIGFMGKRVRIFLCHPDEH